MARRGFGIEHGCGGDRSRCRVDGKTAASIVRQAIGNRVGGGISVAGRGGHADQAAKCRGFVDAVGGGVAVDGG